MGRFERVRCAVHSGDVNAALLVAQGDPVCVGYVQGHGLHFTRNNSVGDLHHWRFGWLALPWGTGNGDWECEFGSTGSRGVVAWHLAVIKGDSVNYGSKDGFGRGDGVGVLVSLKSPHEERHSGLGDGMGHSDACF